MIPTSKSQGRERDIAVGSRRGEKLLNAKEEIWQEAETDACKNTLMRFTGWIESWSIRCFTQIFQYVFWFLKSFNNLMMLWGIKSQYPNVTSIWFSLNKCDSTVLLSYPEQYCKHWFLISLHAVIDMYCSHRPSPRDCCVCVEVCASASGVWGSAQSVSTRVSHSSPTQLSHDRSFITRLSLFARWSVRSILCWMGCQHQAPPVHLSFLDVLGSIFALCACFFFLSPLCSASDTKSFPLGHFLVSFLNSFTIYWSTLLLPVAPCPHLLPFFFFLSDPCLSTLLCICCRKAPHPTVICVSLRVCQPTEIWGVLAGLPSEALGHSEWETESEGDDLFQVEQPDRAGSWEAKRFNQINVPFVILLSALSVCVSVCHLLSVCSSAYPFSVCHPSLSICLSAFQSAWFALPATTQVSWQHHFCCTLRTLLTCLGRNTLLPIRQCIPTLMEQ